MYTEIRFSGLYSSSLRMKSIPYDDSLFISVHCLKGKEIVPLACSDKTYLHTFQFGSDFNSGQSCTSGQPKRSKILISWSFSFVPHRIGFLAINSPIMQPMDLAFIFSPFPYQISNAKEYSSEPRRSSGGLYHSVTTFVVT